MGKKKGKRDDSYFAAERRKNKNTRLMVLAAVVGGALAMVGAGFAYQELNPPPPWVFGTAHEHAVFAVILDGEKIDFSQNRYQVQSSFIHVEGGDGTTLHRHATDVPFSEFLDSVRMDIQNDCFIRDDGEVFCDDGVNQLRYFVNGQEVDSILDYVIEEEDRILIIYGSQTEEEIQREIEELENTPLVL